MVSPELCVSPELWQGLSAFNPEKAAFHAGRVMLKRLQQLVDDRENFAFETTLASRTFAPWLKRLKADGYAFHLFFLWLPSPEVAVARVAERVRLGGHFVPDETVRRRYRSGLDNFFTRYMPIAETWHVFDNSRESEPQLIATHDSETGIFVKNQVVWEQLKGENK